MHQFIYGFLSGVLVPIGIFCYIYRDDIKSFINGDAWH